MNTGPLRPAVATALTVYGIETYDQMYQYHLHKVATALTVYGIETEWRQTVSIFGYSCNSPYRLRYWNSNVLDGALFSLIVATALTVYGIETHYIRFVLVKSLPLQQPLPFTVLKPKNYLCNSTNYLITVATALTVYGIETHIVFTLKNIS